MAKYTSQDILQFTGRKEELKIIKTLLVSNQSELLAVIGRRRVGKTFLVRHGFSKQMCFHYTGIQGASKREQLTAFTNKIYTTLNRKPKSPPSDWHTAFDLLKTLISRKKSKQKKAIFIDEMPWIATAKSGFLPAFEYFWNDWAINQNTVIIICGSAATWMIQNVVNNKGGLHNRITRHINLKPFTLSETETYFKARRIGLPRYEILQIYMAMGGIPYYLKEIESGQSAVQNIDRICFSNQGVLKTEFDNLYSSLFDNATNHIKLVRTLATKRKGMTRNEILSSLSLKSGGGLTRTLTELEESSFITKYPTYGKSQRQSLYRLTDEYSIFYIQFIEKNKNAGKNIWLQLSQKPKYKIWAGFAFEGVVIKHKQKIKEALGIQGIYSEESTFQKRGTKSKEGFQIDLLIDRSDNAIHICEMKFYNTDIKLTKKVTDQLRKRREQFRSESKTKKYLINTIITTFGFTQTTHAVGVVDNFITLDDLF